MRFSQIVVGQNFSSMIFAFGKILTLILGTGRSRRAFVLDGFLIMLGGPAAVVHEQIFFFDRLAFVESEFSS